MVTQTINGVERMGRLHHTIIRNLADSFCSAVAMDRKQSIVDQLGMHPVNHAWFARYLSAEHDLDSDNPAWIDAEPSSNFSIYLQLTATIRADHM